MASSRVQGSQRVTMSRWSNCQRCTAMHMTSTVSAPPERRGINNRLLLALPPATLDLILRISEPVSLLRGQRIDCAGQPIKHIHFINRGLVCIAKTLEDGKTVEIGAIGVEGVTNLLPFVGIHKTILDVAVQIPGTALRMGCDAITRELGNDNAFQQVVQNYARFGLSELARHIACSRLHHIEQRCCRWLLIAHDNALSDTFPVTHEFLAMMLGYQRAGVSIAMGSLVRAGLIEHKRGTVTIVNRPGLETSACDCYREMQDELDEFFPPAKSARVFGFKQNTITSRR
jgi:CRP-like cAMP-binding protein